MMIESFRPDITGFEPIMKRSWLPLAAALPALLLCAPAALAEQLPWNGNQGDYQPAPDYPAADPSYAAPAQPAYQPPRRRPYTQPAVQQVAPPAEYGYDNPVQPPEPLQPGYSESTYGPEDISRAGHRAFGRVTTDLASVVEYAFQHYGRPNGYILGEEGGGAFVAGLRYGEGTLYTRNAGTRKVYWQGPSIGYDFGGEGSKTMVLVYNLHNPDDVYYNYTGVGGQAYLVGGLGLTYLKSGPVTMAPIRSGVGLRIGANVGYLKFTRSPTWNPF